MKERNKVMFSTPQSSAKKKLISKSASKLPTHLHRGKAFPPPPPSPSESKAVQNLRQLSSTILTPRRKALSAENSDCDDSFPPKLSNAEHSSSSIKVAVRIRPFSKQELEFVEGDKQVVHFSSDRRKVIVTNPKRDYQRFEFEFDHVLWSMDPNDRDYVNQEKVYAKIGRPLLEHAYQGFNVCLFAYGITSTGKSYSIMGNPESPGIVRRLAQDLFFQKDEIEKEEKDTSVTLELSYLEIYNEKIHDLLIGTGAGNSMRKQNLSVREHPVTGPFVEGLSKYEVLSPTSVLDWIDMGNRVRATAVTGLNDHSSRSHSVITLALTKKQLCHVSGKTLEQTTISKINIIDLAGSEKQKSSHCEGDRLIESCNINKSLLALGKVISGLSESQEIASNVNNGNNLEQPDRFISYRDSVLTRLLKESLGGNSKTTMLATISPSLTCVEETINTLRYAKKAQSIVNVPRINEDTNVNLLKDLLMKDIKAKQSIEFDDLRNKLVNKNTEIESLKNQVEILEKELNDKNAEILKSQDVNLTLNFKSVETQCDDIETLFQDRLFHEVNNAEIKIKNEIQSQLEDSLQKKDNKIKELFERLTTTVNKMKEERVQNQKRMEELLQQDHESKSLEDQSDLDAANCEPVSLQMASPSPTNKILRNFRTLRLIKEANQLAANLNFPLTIQSVPATNPHSKLTIRVINNSNNSCHHIWQSSLQTFVTKLKELNSILNESDYNETSQGQEISSISTSSALSEEKENLHGMHWKKQLSETTPQKSSPKFGSKRTASLLTSPSPNCQSSGRGKIMRNRSPSISHSPEAND